MLSWINDHPVMLVAMTLLSIAMLIGSMLVIPMIAVRLPSDYFMNEKRPPSWWSTQSTWMRIIMLAGKNVLGVILLLAGLAMLVLPGQGLVAIFVGILLIDFPGKFRVQRWLVSKPFVKRPLNWMRRNKGRPPLVT